MPRRPSFRSSAVSILRGPRLPQVTAARLRKARCSASTGAGTFERSHSTCRTPSPRGVGLSMWACAATYIEGSPKSHKSNRVSAFPTTSSQATRFCAFLTPAFSRLPSMKIWSSPAGRAILCWTLSLAGHPGRFAPVSATSSMRDSSKRLAGTWSLMATISGSTRTTLTTSATC